MTADILITVCGLLLCLTYSSPEAWMDKTANLLHEINFAGDMPLRDGVKKQSDAGLEEACPPG